jgi:DNA polymerase III subunit alpha
MFIHLRLHSEFSVVDGTVRIDDVVAAAAADGQPALALTDYNNLFGAIKFYKAARGAGVQPLLGAEVQLQDLGPPAAPGASVVHQALPRMLLLAQGRQGYLNLCELLARGWTHGVVRDQATLRWDWLKELHEGLIVLSGAAAGPVGMALLAGDEARAADTALQLASAFPHRFYLELQRAGRPDDERHVQATVPLAARLGLPVVATHPVQFLLPDDYEAHEARVCISEGEILANQRRVRRFTREQYFKSAQDMARPVCRCAQCAGQHAGHCAALQPVSGAGQAAAARLSHSPGERAVLSTEDYFRHVSQEGLEQRLRHLYPKEAEREAQRPRYQERLEFELNTILKMGFPGYFLIVGDFIQWAKHNGCPVGPGRGSGAGSLVAYALQITDLDPLQYNLLFERFLNPERVSMPDFDIDFCQTNRDRVIDYVKDKYGKDAVSQIATFGTMAARAAIRDVGRVLDFPTVSATAFPSSFRTSRACRSRCSTRPSPRKRATRTTTPSPWSRCWPSACRRKTMCARS